MTAHSDWNELRELSDDVREAAIDKCYQNIASVALIRGNRPNKIILDYIAVTLDRIKALIMSRPCNQEK